MKRIISNVMLFAAAAMAFVSCQKQEMSAPETPQDVVLTFASEKPAFADETKTEWTGADIQWSQGDKIAVAYTVDGNWQNASGNASGDAKLYKSDELADSGLTAQFNVSTSFKGNVEGVHVFYGVYPAPSGTDFPNAPIAILTIPSVQTPKTNSFDAAGDLMVGVSGEYNSRPESSEKISLSWNRLVAHAVITLKNIKGFTAGETLTGITLTAQEGANLVGEQKIDLTTGAVENNNDAGNIVKLAPGSLSVDAAGTVSFWACVLPETLTSLTVEVDTDQATYSREITGISKTFKQNARNTLAIDMSSATRVAKETESWVLVTPADGITEGTYALVASTSTETGVLVSTNGSSAAPTFNTGVTVENNILKGVAESMQFDITGSVDNWILSVVDDATKWLYCTNANNGVRVGNNDNKTWTISAHETANAFVVKHNGTNRYLGVYSNKDWRCYDALTKLDGVDGNTGAIYFYKKESGAVAPDPTAPKLTLKNTSIELSASKSEGTIEFVSENVEDLEVGAYADANHSEFCDWLEVELGDGVVSYVAQENEGAARTAYIRINGFDTKGEFFASSPAVVTQAAAESLSTYASLTDLVSAGAPTTTARKVTVTLKDEVITGIYTTSSGYRNGVFLQVGEQEIEIFSYDVPAEWEIGGTISGTLKECDWKLYNTTWELCPADWSELTYTAPEGGSTEPEPENPEVKVVTAAEFNAATDNSIEYQVSGTISGIYQAYNADYNNISLYISDETGEILAYRLSCEGITDPANTLTKGDLITVKGKRTLYETNPQMGQGGVIVEHTDVVVVAPVGSVTLSFADKANRTTCTSSQQVWEQNGIKLINDKGSSTSNVGDYANPARFYKSSKITVEYPGMTKIEFTCNSSSYANALKSSITTGTVSVSGSVVTVELEEAADSYMISSLTGGQVRMDSITVFAN